MPPLCGDRVVRGGDRGGTYLGGWRAIRTMSKGLVEIESPQGMAADTSSATIILLSSHFGYALSTTTSRPARSWAAGSASPALRCAGLSRAGWSPRG